MTEPKFINAGSSGEWGWHATELAMRCPRLFAYNHRCKVESFREGDRPPLLKGSLVHQGLAHHYARIQAEQRGEDPEQWATPELAIEHEAVALGQYAAQYVPLAKKAVAEYRLHWLHEKLDVLNVEDVFTAEIGGFKFTQRFDLVVRDHTGKVVIIDHKTTGRISSSGTRYTLSGQFLGMMAFGRNIWGDEFGGVRINFIELPQLLAAPCKFTRIEPDPAPMALKGFSLTVLHARQRIEHLDASGIPPNEWPMALSEQTCVTPYGLCDAFELCRWE
jgi:hypothetical protein